MLKEVNLSLCFVYDEQRILLGMKKRGFGRGKWNGFGGKLENGESTEEAALRELEEEIRIKAVELRPRGIIDFYWIKERSLHHVNLFSVSKFTGKPVESEEMLPMWFNRNEIPYDNMWIDDKVWLPYILNERNIKSHFNFYDNDNFLSYHIIDLNGHP